MKKLLIPLILIILDQLTKFLFKDVHFLFINYQTNYGATFSILQGYRFLFVLVAIIVLIVIIYYYRSYKHKLPLLLIFAGTFGNLIDRIFLGYVRDFIDLKFWPIFNIADTINVIGVLLLVYYLTKEK